LVIFTHVAAIVPDGRILLLRLIDKWEATISRAASEVKTARHTAMSAAVATLGISFIGGQNALEYLTERYDEKTETLTIVFLIRIKSGTDVRIDRFREMKAMTLQELAYEAKTNEDVICNRTHYLLEIFRDLNLVGPK